jgi:predicted O-linked N-acetylglucosamine transferase (SPINDLY family)
MHVESSKIRLAVRGRGKRCLRRGGAQRDELHVLVDLMGYTHGMRTGILAHRPAPVQLAFKGYMSTCGAEYVPLLVSDRVSVPPELATFYAEKQARAPRPLPPPGKLGGGAPARRGAHNPSPAPWRGAGGA